VSIESWRNDLTAINQIVISTTWTGITQWYSARQGLGIFLFTTVPRPALGPTQPPIQWVPGALSLGVKRPEREADHSPPSSVEAKNAWSYTSIPQQGAGIARWYSAGLGAGWSGVRVPSEAGNFSLHYSAQTGSGAHPASYPMGTRSSFPGGKAVRAWNWPLTSI
jgi:hypothetical protein